MALPASMPAGRPTCCWRWSTQTSRGHESVSRWSIPDGSLAEATPTGDTMPTIPTRMREWLPDDENNGSKAAPSEAAIVSMRKRWSEGGESLVAEWKLPADKKDRQLVGVGGKWYDVTDFIARHPGGPVIREYIGKDATDVFHAMGHAGVLKYRRPVGTYTMAKMHAADQDFRELGKFFKDNGYFDTNWGFIYRKVVFAFLLLAAVLVCVLGSDKAEVHYLGAMFLTGFWQQCGFFMHDFMHTQVFQDPVKDRAGGMLFGTFLFGVSAHWWQDEHFVHHSVTCTVDANRQFVDPQMWEDVWAQHPILFPFFKGNLKYLLIKIQHLTFIPVTALLGRVGIMVDSFIKERRWYEWLVGLGHWAWICGLLSCLPTWREVAVFYAIAAILEGVLHFQLVFSHYCKPFHDLTEFLHSSWFLHQVETNMNISNPWWMDWFYGGLNFHIEHHCFPRMPRDSLRDAAPFIQDLCKKHGLTYDSIGFFGALRKTLRSLKETGRHYSLDPR